MLSSATVMLNDLMVSPAGILTRDDESMYKVENYKM